MSKFIEKARTVALVPAVLIATSPVAAFAQEVTPNTEMVTGVNQLKSDATTLIGVLITIVIATAGFALFKSLSKRAN